MHHVEGLDKQTGSRDRPIHLLVNTDVRRRTLSLAGQWKQKLMVVLLHVNGSV